MEFYKKICLSTTILLLNTHCHGTTYLFNIEVAQSTWHRQNGHTSRWGLALQKQWPKSGNLSGYTELSMSHWRIKPSMRSAHNIRHHSNITEAGITPVIRYTYPTRLIQPYTEIGIGAHYLNKSRYGVKNLSTNFQFGDHIGFGLRYQKKQRFELGYRFQHYSNANIKKPNPGINFHVLKLSTSI